VKTLFSSAAAAGWHRIHGLLQPHRRSTAISIDQRPVAAQAINRPHDASGLVQQTPATRSSFLSLRVNRYVQARCSAAQRWADVGGPAFNTAFL
jgi:hypothetical protein